LGREFWGWGGMCLTGFCGKSLKAQRAQRTAAEGAEKIFTSKDTKGFPKGTKDGNGFSIKDSQGARGEDLAQGAADPTLCGPPAKDAKKSKAPGLERRETWGTQGNFRSFRAVQRRHGPPAPGGSITSSASSSLKAISCRHLHELRERGLSDHSAVEAVFSESCGGKEK
jgi:hypothetical protein